MTTPKSFITLHYKETVYNTNHAPNVGELVFIRRSNSTVAFRVDRIANVYSTNEDNEAYIVKIQVFLADDGFA